MIEIISKTDDYVIIYKPAGIPSQSDPGGDSDAMSICRRLLREMGEKDALYLIHRLDRVVSGLMVFARNKRSAVDLSLQVSERDFGKSYFAVVEGRAEGGVLSDYIYKDPRLNKAFITDRKRAGVKSCELEYECKAICETWGKTLSLVKISLKTGRFHQIRAQFSSRKMPLIGDKKYGSRDFKAKMPSLFATEISFRINEKEVKASRLPDLSEYPWSLFTEDKYD
jgi:23S rRNA pseudouridine1911/1915/1917 synthase